MKKLMLGALAAALAMPAGAQIIPPTSPNGTVLTNYNWEAGFRNRGQCVSALAQERNLQRANPQLRGSGYQNLGPVEFMQESKRTTRCEQLSNGRYYIVFNSSGF